MKTPVEQFLDEIRDHALFPALVAMAKQQRPHLPIFDPAKDNTERWKLDSGRRQGFDFCLSLFGIKSEDLE